MLAIPRRRPAPSWSPSIPARCLRGCLRGCLRRSPDRGRPAPGDRQPAFPEYVVLELGAEPLSIGGVVVDADGNPRPGIRVWIEDPTPFGIVGEDTRASVEFTIGLPRDVAADELVQRSYWESVTTDSNGEFRVVGLLPRAYTLRLLDTSTLHASSVGPVDAGTEGLRCTLDPAQLGRVAGTLSTPNGAPAPGVQVSLYGWCYGGISTSLSSGSRTTDVSGRFDFGEVGAGRMHLSARGDAILPASFPLDEEGPRDELSLVVVPRCHFKVDSSGEPDRFDAFRVTGPAGEGLSLYVVSPDGVWTTDRVPLAAGLSPTVGVAPDAATLVLLREDAEVHTVDLRLTPGELQVVKP